MLFKKYAPGGFVLMTDDEKRKELAQMVDQLVAALENVQIAADNLRESYGVTVIDASIFGQHKIHIDNGIDALAHVLDRKAISNDKHAIMKEFVYSGVRIVQFANKGSTDFAEIDDDGKALRKLSPRWKT